MFGKKNKDAADGRSVRSIEELMGETFSTGENQIPKQTEFNHSVEIEAPPKDKPFVSTKQKSSLFSGKPKKVEDDSKHLDKFKEEPAEVAQESLDNMKNSRDLDLAKMADEKARKIANMIDKLSSQPQHKTVYLLTSLGGTGARTIAAAVAKNLSKSERVLLVDFDFINPKSGRYLKLNVTVNKSITGYFAGAEDLKDIIVHAEENMVSNGNQNLYVASATFLDEFRMYEEVLRSKVDQFFTEARSAFDYIIVTVPYHPYSEFFAYTALNSDVGAVVWDEQWSCPIITGNILDYLRKIHFTSIFQNVILNKRTNYQYDVNIIKNLNCNLVCEIPMVVGLHADCNDGSISLDSLGMSKGQKESLLRFFKI